MNKIDLRALTLMGPLRHKPVLDPLVVHFLKNQLYMCYSGPNPVEELTPNFPSNKTGLQPISRPVELVHYFGGWVEGPKMCIN